MWVISASDKSLGQTKNFHNLAKSKTTNKLLRYSLLKLRKNIVSILCGTFYRRKSVKLGLVVVGVSAKYRL